MASPNSTNSNSQQTGDPEIATRIAQYEMAFRMQTSVPELTDLSDEPASTFDLYGADAQTARHVRRRTACSPGGWSNAACGSCSSIIAAGTSTAACRRTSRKQCHDIDQPQAALIRDLKQRGLLDDTLVIWGGEFGRTVYGQGGLQDNYGRDHHGRCFTMWLAGGGIKPGAVLRRDRRLRLQHRPTTRSTSTTSTPRSCTAWASTTNG